MSILLANPFGDMQWLIVALIVLLLFGNRLPSVMRNMGQGVKEFKKGIAGVDDEDEKKESPPPKLDNQQRPAPEEKKASSEQRTSA